MWSPRRRLKNKKVHFPDKITEALDVSDDNVSTQSAPLTTTTAMPLPKQNWACFDQRLELSEIEKAKLAAMNTLSEEERRQIANVLERDVKLQKQEQQRLMMSKVAITVYDNELKDQNRRRQQKAAKQIFERRCSVCIASLGYLTNLGFQCYDCSQRACKQCIQRSENGHRICKTCQLHRDYKATSGKWFYEGDEKQGGSLQDLELVKTPSTKFLTEIKRMTPRRSDPEIEALKVKGKKAGPRRASTFAVMDRFRKLQLPRSKSKEDTARCINEQSRGRLYARRSTEATIVGAVATPKKNKSVEGVRRLGKLRRGSSPNLNNVSASNPNLKSQSDENLSAIDTKPHKELSIRYSLGSGPIHSAKNPAIASLVQRSASTMARISPKKDKSYKIQSETSDSKFTTPEMIQTPKLSVEEISSTKVPQSIVRTSHFQYSLDLSSPAKELDGGFYPSTTATHIQCHKVRSLGEMKPTYQRSITGLSVPSRKQDFYRSHMNIQHQRHRSMSLSLGTRNNRGTSPQISLEEASPTTDLIAHIAYNRRKSKFSLDIPTPEDDPSTSWPSSISLGSTLSQQTTPQTTSPTSIPPLNTTTLKSKHSLDLPIAEEFSDECFPCTRRSIQSSISSNSLAKTISNRSLFTVAEEGQTHSKPLSPVSSVLSTLEPATWKIVESGPNEPWPTKNQTEKTLFTLEQLTVITGGKILTENWLKRDKKSKDFVQPKTEKSTEPITKKSDDSALPTAKKSDDPVLPITKKSDDSVLPITNKSDDSVILTTTTVTKTAPDNDARANKTKFRKWFSIDTGFSHPHSTDAHGGTNPDNNVELNPSSETKTENSWLKASSKLKNVTTWWYGTEKEKLVKEDDDKWERVLGRNKMKLRNLTEETNDEITSKLLQKKKPPKISRLQRSQRVDTSPEEHQKEIAQRKRTKVTRRSNKETRREASIYGINPNHMARYRLAIEATKEDLKERKERKKRNEEKLKQTSSSWSSQERSPKQSRGSFAMDQWKRLGKKLRSASKESIEEIVGKWHVRAKSENPEFYASPKKQVYRNPRRQTTYPGYKPFERWGKVAAKVKIVAALSHGAKGKETIKAEELPPMSAIDKDNEIKPVNTTTAKEICGKEVGESNIERPIITDTKPFVKAQRSHGLMRRTSRKIRNNLLPKADSTDSSKCKSSNAEEVEENKALKHYLKARDKLRSLPEIYTTEDTIPIPERIPHRHLSIVAQEKSISATVTSTTEKQQPEIRLTSISVDTIEEHCEEPPESPSPATVHYQKKTERRDRNSLTHQISILSNETIAEEDEIDFRKQKRSSDGGTAKALAVKGRERKLSSVFNVDTLLEMTRPLSDDEVDEDDESENAFDEDETQNAFDMEALTVKTQTRRLTSVFNVDTLIQMTRPLSDDDEDEDGMQSVPGMDQNSDSEVNDETFSTGKSNYFAKTSSVSHIDDLDWIMSSPDSETANKSVSRKNPFSNDLLEEQPEFSEDNKMGENIKDSDDQLKFLQVFENAQIRHSFTKFRKKTDQPALSPHLLRAKQKGKGQSNDRNRLSSSDNDLSPTETKNRDGQPAKTPESPVSWGQIASSYFSFGSKLTTPQSPISKSPQSSPGTPTVTNPPSSLVTPPTPVRTTFQSTSTPAKTPQNVSKDSETAKTTQLLASPVPHLTRRLSETALSAFSLFSTSLSSMKPAAESETESDDEEKPTTSRSAPPSVKFPRKPVDPQVKTQTSFIGAALASTIPFGQTSFGQLPSSIKPPRRQSALISFYHIHKMRTKSTRTETRRRKTLVYTDKYKMPSPKSSKRSFRLRKKKPPPPPQPSFIASALASVLPMPVAGLGTFGQVPAIPNTATVPKRRNTLSTLEGIFKSPAPSTPAPRRLSEGWLNFAAAKTQTRKKSSKRKWWRFFRKTKKKSALTKLLNQSAKSTQTQIAYRMFQLML